MPDTIAVPRETLERWRTVATDAVEIGLTRRVEYLANEIGKLLAQPAPVSVQYPPDDDSDWAWTVTP